MALMVRGGYLAEWGCACGVVGHIFVDVLRGMAECQGCGRQAVLYPMEFEHTTPDGAELAGEFDPYEGWAL
ncbi:hypothetical protein [Streptosporangium sp. NPDC023615]|uniref:hypothetical protein n=1 Tax=Streptosporangium sp. NPDC023615 TaxID=3154794 RepID=UPI00341D796C